MRISPSIPPASTSSDDTAAPSRTNQEQAPENVKQLELGIEVDRTIQEVKLRIVRNMSGAPDPKKKPNATSTRRSNEP